MDLANLKNIDLKNIIQKMKSGGFSDKKILIKFAGGFVAILIFLISYYIFVSPIVQAQVEQINIMNENKIKIEEFKNNIIRLKSTVKNLEPEYEKNSKLFHSKKEVEDLYQNISKFALINGLSITNLKKGVPKAVAGDPQAQNTGQTNKNSSGQNTTTNDNPEGQKELYYTIPVDYEIQGNFLSYLKFRRALSKSQKVINFDKEEISTIAEVQGQILSKGTISIVGLPSEYK
ncbi:pilus assembly protein PilO [Candidatus Pelagibacter sp. Uisw_090]|uniref:pilus assembly protein PilO n=1 Tax=Candidatus Pelagibacter sp. Uisw_090 TaxID=3230993 RepID=UPI0039EB7A38